MLARLALLLPACAAAVTPVAAPELASSPGIQIRIEQLKSGGWQVEGIDLRVHSDLQSIAINLTIDKLSSPILTLRALDWRCAALPAPSTAELPVGQDAVASAESTPHALAPTPPACAGPLRIDGHRHGSLRWDAATAQQLAWQDRKAKLHVQKDVAVWSLDLQQFPLQQLKPLLDAGLGQDAGGISITSGTLSGALQWDADATAMTGDIEIRELAFDARGGRAGGAGIAVHSTLLGKWDVAGDADLRLDAQLRAGEWLAGPFYALPPDSLRLGIAANLQQDVLRSVEIRAGDALGNALDARLDWAADAPLEQSVWQAKLRSEALEGARAPYLEGLLAWAGQADLHAEGNVAIEIDGQAGALERVQLQSSGLGLSDASRGLLMSRASGTLGWQRAGVGPAGHWTAPQLRVAGVDLGALSLHGQARDGRWGLLQPLQLELLGGSLEISAAEWAPRAGEALLSAQMDDVELAQLTAWLQWPLIEGRLSGKIPAARYADQRWVLDGGLSGNLLGGQLTLDALSWERPFGIAPSISADIRFNDLDLEPLTATFGFGAISGRLDGEILGLRMLDGAPVQFDARLRTDPSWKGSQRISQRAVRDLSNVGGAGIAGGIQQSVLRAFDEFSYRRIGLSCKLEQDVCLMGGLDSRNGGYTVVEGSGLPRITVNGFQRRVDWPVLLARLEAATAGRGVRVE